MSMMISMTNPGRRRSSLIAAMIVSIVTVGGLTYWDADREATVALLDFAQEQATLAGALAAALQSGSTGQLAGRRDETLARLGAIERPKVLLLLQHRDGEAFFRTTDGRQVASAHLLQSLATRQSVVRLPRSDAAALGLYPRTALAGLARIGDNVPGSSPGWDILAVASAGRERDRGRWAHQRLVLSVLAAASLVVVFGGIAMRNQRKELTLQRELAMASLEKSGDERLQRANKAAIMGTLAMGVAHEISTPLGVIVARAERMLGRVSDNPLMSEGMSAILVQADRIDQVMRGLLGLARGDAPSAERVEPGTVLANAVELVEHRFAKAGVPLFHEVAPNLPAVLGDARLLEHAVVNLLLNAADACRVGGVVTVRAQLAAGAVQISVEDTGVGISMADVGRALEPFFTTKAREGGTGLGLAIVHEIVQNHRGALTFAAVLPQGTRASIRLPPADRDGYA